ncbi:MAG TPA: right-handed parallel beta-helix repeat-containing protein, partial [Verrucomicrobiota bacterium]|nr:right-handed parallel beta-helix repeat-containing protein [Verrucomicrobiota bacterium]
MKRIPVAPLLMGFALPLAAAEWHVRPDGDDAAAGTAAAPLRSVAAAADRSRGAGGTLVLHAGRHELAAPLALGTEHSGLTLTAAPGARPVLSGGTRITGWRRDETSPGLWRGTLPEGAAGRWHFHQLFVDGRRAQRARTPNEGFLRAAGPLSRDVPMKLPFRAGDLRAAWAGRPDARLIMLQKWTDLHVPILAVDEAAGVALLPAERPRPDWMSEGDARYWIENVPEALDAPDEWFLDRATGELRYLAPPGTDPNAAEVIAPRLTEIVRVAGDPAARKPVTGVTFRGLTFAHTDYEMPERGLHSPQAAVPVRGAFRVEHAVGGVIEACRFENLGGYAVELSRGAQRWCISRCAITGSGGGGIRIGEPGERQPDDFTANHSHEVSDCDLHALGRIFAPAVGIIIFQSGTNRIVHNAIHDLYYTAVSVGWNWGYQETPCRENLIAFNHLHHVGQGRLSDMGGVYTLGIQHGTVVSSNLIHDVSSHDYGGWGLYTDEGSTGIVMEHNVVYRCRSAGFHQHYGRDNVIRHNVIAFNRENQLMRTRDEDHSSFTFTNNIVFFDSGVLLGSSWRNDRFVIQDNLYWNTRAGGDPAKMTFAGGTW